MVSHHAKGCKFCEAEEWLLPCATTPFPTNLKISTNLWCGIVLVCLPRPLTVLLHSWALSQTCGELSITGALALMKHISNTMFSQCQDPKYLHLQLNSLNLPSEYVNSTLERITLSLQIIQRKIGEKKIPIPEFYLISQQNLISFLPPILLIL